MKVVIIYESLFGNTGAIAHAIAAGCQPAAEIELVPIVAATREHATGAHLIVVGGPTHVHGMSSAVSRKAAAEDSDLPDEVVGRGIRDWLGELVHSEGPAAAFDTRLDRAMVLTGAASHVIGRRLKRRGYRLIVPPESFLVADAEGPLVEGELDRATEWGRALITALGTPV
jgi:hypothetical protein